MRYNQVLIQLIVCTINNKCLLSTGFTIFSSTILPTTKHSSKQRNTCIILQSTTNSSNRIDQPISENDDNDDGGISTFEQWFESITSNNKDNQSMKLLKHNFFSNGRGLEFVASKADLLNNSGSPIITLPKEYVLQSIFIEKDVLEDIATDWDVALAMKLLRECKLGINSKIYGYCSLLTRGKTFNTANPCPPSTAPDTVRNWSDDEKEMLKTTQRGERLLRAEQKQSQEWVDKYAALSKSDRDDFTYPQFRWAMEAVHSRAFKGNFTGQDPLKELSKALIPFAAGAFALNYIRSDPFAANESFSFIFLALSCAPVILNFLSDNLNGGKIEAVMLPFIDSANHKETAQSEISFDPLKGAFTVSAEGMSCIEKDGKMNQFYISYGKKFDTELLLNYGFLNGLKEQNQSQKERRKMLAEIFNSRSIQ